MSEEDTPRTLRELIPLFNDTSKHAPYLSAYVTVPVKFFIIHPDTEDGKWVEPHCTLQLETLPPSEDEDSFLVGEMEKNTTSLVINGVETINPNLSLEEIIEAFKLDIDTPIWHLGYE